jgi:GMP synthase (glutamine-hydrolysing)
MHEGEVKKRVLLLKPGRTSSRAVLGDYEVWFSRATDAQMTPVELHEGERAPSVSGFDAVMMTGSPLSVTQPTEWMERAADFLVEAAERVPVLGVCFGHQLIAWKHGARVVKNPKGRELGTVFVELTSAGRHSPLFAGFPERFDSQATHEDIVEGGPLTVLARNDACEVQAFQVGPRTWGVQFHPEMDRASIQFCIDSKDTLETDRARAVARETPWGERLLRQFLSLV